MWVFNFVYLMLLVFGNLFKIDTPFYCSDYSKLSGMWELAGPVHESTPKEVLPQGDKTPVRGENFLISFR
jgi:hypothetical protein